VAWSHASPFRRQRAGGTVVVVVGVSVAPAALRAPTIPATKPTTTERRPLRPETSFASASNRSAST
jgi:hypothetical protein